MGANFITDNQAVYRWNKQGIELCNVVAVGHECRRSRTGKFSCKFIFPFFYYFYYFIVGVPNILFRSFQYIVLCTRVCHTLYCVQSRVRATRDGRKYHDNWQSGSRTSRPSVHNSLSLTAQSPAIPSLHVSSEAATCPSQPKIQIFQSLIVLSTVSQVWQQCLTTIAIWHSPYARTARHQQLLFGGEMKSARYSVTLAAFSSSSTVVLVR